MYKRQDRERHRERDREGERELNPQFPLPSEDTPRECYASLIGDSSNSPSGTHSSRDQRAAAVNGAVISLPQGTRRETGTGELRDALCKVCVDCRAWQTVRE